MCRLLATVSSQQHSVAETLGSGWYSVLNDMAQVHRDGWGHAWVNPWRRLSTVRAPASAAQNGQLRQACEQQWGLAHLIHLRLATGGFSPRCVNTHPFHADQLAFAHNGSLLPLDGFDGLIDDDVQASIRGDTDSERYFAVVRTQVRCGMSLEAAVNASIRLLRERFPGRSFNAMLLSPEQLLVVHANSGAVLPSDELRSRLSGQHCSQARAANYYRMHIRQEPGKALAVASNGLELSGWQLLPSESLTTVELATLRVRVHSLG